METLKHWWFTLGLIVSYVLTFELWLGQPHDRIKIIAGIALAILVSIMVFAARQEYFISRLDVVIHGVVLLDLGLEGGLIPWHMGQGHLICATGFLLVIGGYRWLSRAGSHPAGKAELESSQGDVR